MDRANNYSMLLLAGGKSLRMGTNKAELLYKGKTFVENLIEKAEYLGIKHIYLSGYQEDRQDVNVIWDIYPEVGPLGGLHAGMKNIETACFLVLPVDVPQIPESFLEDLISYHEKKLLGSDEENIPLILEHQGFLEPLIGIYPKDMADFVEERIKNQYLSVFRMLKEWGCVCYKSNIPEEYIANVNTQEDYAKLLK